MSDRFRVFTVGRGYWCQGENPWEDAGRDWGARVTTDPEFQFQHLKPQEEEPPVQEDQQPVWLD